MPTNVRPIPEGYHSITPQLTCRDAARAIDFYKQALGAKEIMRMPGPDGRVMHAELQIGDSRFMIGDEFPGMSVAPDSSKLHATSLFVYTEDVDSLFNRAVKAGARADMPPSDMFWGDRYGSAGNAAPLRRMDQASRQGRWAIQLTLDFRQNKPAFLCRRAGLFFFAPSLFGSARWQTCTLACAFDRDRLTC